MVLLPSFISKAQTNPNFWHLSVEQGLSNATVTCILQDKQGFMWFGTDDGLNRYDGYHFKVYRKDLNNNLSLPDNLIENMIEDKEGNLWIATTKGLAKYNPQLDKIERINEIRNTVIFGLLIDDKGNLWICGDNQLAILDMKTKKWQFLTSLFEDKHNFNTLAQSSPEDFWISSDGKGIYHLQLSTQKTTLYQKQTNNPNSLTDNTTHDIFYDGKGSLWIPTYYGGISKFDIATKQFTNFKAEAGNPNTILTNGVSMVCQDGEDLLFAVENGGISRYNTRTGTFSNILHDEKVPFSLISNTTRSIYKDRQGRIWVGTFSKGLSIWDRYKEKFKQLEVPLSSKIVNSLFMDSKQRLWIGTEEGVAMKDKEKITYFKHDPKDPKSLSANPVLSIHEDNKRRVWLGTWLGGINLYDENKNNFINYLNKGNTNKVGTANLNCVFALANDIENEQLVIGSYGGVQALNEANGAFEDFISYINRSIKEEYVHDVRQDSKGNWWVATLNGLHFFDAKTKQQTLYLNTEQDKNSLSNNGALCLLEDSKQRMWVGTREGLNLMTAQGKFKKFTVADGLPSNEINSIIEDEHGHLWIGTNQGLSLFDLEKNEFKNYTESDGLVSKQCKVNAITKSAEGEIFVGTTNGVNHFFHDDVKDNPYLPPVIITDFKIFNQSVKVGMPDSPLSKAINHTPSITLTHEHSVFSFDFVALNFTQSEKNQYAYRLEPFEKQWNKVGSQRNATYTNLDAGTYVFHVQASNNDGLWNEEGAKITIIVLPPWWATWWFRVLVIGSIVGGTFAFYKFRVAFLKKQNRKLEKTVHERTLALENANEELIQQKEELEQSNEFIKLQSDKLLAINNQKDKLFSIISHDLRSPMAALKNVIDILDFDSLDKTELETIKAELTKHFTKTDFTLQSLLQWAKTQMQGENSKPVLTRLRKITSEIIDFLDNIASQKQIELRNEISEGVEVLVDRNHLQTILRNLISNALKFTNRKGSIVVYSLSKNNFIETAVQDTGIGMTELAKSKLFSNIYYTSTGTEGEAGSGFGLTIVKDLVEKNGGKIWVESEIGKGSTFYFTLPKS
jgi:ligand-binding sensor domain-containing protein/signal transduction histidine kinase